MKKDIEFALTAEGRILVMSEAGPSFLKDERELIDELCERIRTEFPQAYEALAEYYKASKLNRQYYRYRIVRKFVSCNFGSFDETQRDIDDQCNFNFEKVNCPARGECPLENIVCNPIFATGLTQREEEVIRAACSGDTATELADKLNVSVYTVRSHMNRIMKKLGYHKFAEVIKWWNDKGNNP